MKLVRTVDEIRSQVREYRRQGLSVGLVPTMGWFHQGHLSLMEMAKNRCDQVVVSLFVNPIQFGAGEDLDSYPRDLERDRKMAQSVGVDLLFAPDAAEMYPPGFQSMVRVGKLSHGLCGGSRPGHFDGVCTVVSKLFHQVEPDRAFFGEKDFQQLAVIRRMVIDLDMAVEIVGCPVVREDDGLAMSSRNVYLGPEDRKAALSLIGAIRCAQAMAKQSDSPLDAVQLRHQLVEQINSVAGCEVDYVQVVDRDSLEDVALVDERSRLILAVRVAGKVRLIDNAAIV